MEACPVGSSSDLWKKELIPSGPLLAKQEIEKDKIRLSFNYTGRGLMVGEKGN